MRRTALIVLLLLLAAMASPVLAESNPSDVAADFNHDGFADLAIGVPAENGIGAVNVLYGTGGGLSGSGGQLFINGGDLELGIGSFGAAVAAGDFNHDGFADLAAGAPTGQFRWVLEAGTVSVIRGTADGVYEFGGPTYAQFAGATESGDQFGFTLATGDFNHDGFDDLAVGAPGEDVGSIRDAGAVSVRYGSAGGLSASSGRLFTQVAGAVEGDDRFGSALAAGDFDHNGFVDLAVGAPGEAVGRAAGAGAVSVLPGSAAGLTSSGGRLFTQVAGAVEGGDRFGFALAAGDFNHNGFVDLAAGAPFETVGASTFGAGAVSVLQGSAGGLTSSGGRLFTQVAGAVERGDLFGWAVAGDDFNNDGFVDLTVGAPFEDAGSIRDAGAVSVLYGSGAGLTSRGARLFTQVAGAVEGRDHFGSQLAAGDFNNNGFADLAAAAPSESVGSASGAGAVSVLYGSGAGLTTSGGQLFTQNSPGVPGAAEAFDHFGGIDLIAG